MQKGFTVWLTGMPGAGKTTSASLLVQRLRASGASVEMLDGDGVRTRSSKDRDAYDPQPRRDHRADPVHLEPPDGQPPSPRKSKAGWYGVYGSRAELACLWGGRARSAAAIKFAQDQTHGTPRWMPEPI